MAIYANSRSHRRLYLICLLPVACVAMFYGFVWINPRDPSIVFDAMVHNKTKTPITVLLVWDSSDKPPVWLTIEPNESRLAKSIFEGEAMEEVDSRHLFVFSWRLDKGTEGLRFRLSESSFISVQSYKGIDVFRNYHMFVHEVMDNTVGGDR